MSRGMISPGRLFAVLLLAETGLVGMLVRSTCVVRCLLGA